MSRMFPIALFLFPLAHLTFRARYWEAEDALIYFRYIRNFMNGKGLVFNEGSYVNALTSPLYSYLHIAFSYLVGDIRIASVLLFGTSMALSLIVFTMVFSDFSNRYFAAFSAALMACSLYIYSTMGMEAPLYILTIGMCLLFFERKNILGLGIACALLLLTRAEGIFLILAMAAEHFRQKRPFPKAGYFVLPAIILGGDYLFNWFYYGSALPQSTSAKIYLGRSELWGEWPTAFLRGFIATAKRNFYGNWILFLGSAGLALYGIVELRLRSINVICICFLCLLSCFYVFLNIPYHQWYAVPYYVFAYFYAGVGAFHLFRSFRKNGNIWIKRISVSALSLLMTYLIAFNFYRSHKAVRHYLTPPSNVHPAYNDIGTWIKHNTPEDAKLAAAEIGRLGWYSDRYMIDLCGLVSPPNAELVGKKDFGGWLKYYSPDYVIVHDPIWGLESAMEKAVGSGDFVVARTFDGGENGIVWHEKNARFILYVRKNTDLSREEEKEGSRITRMNE